MKPFDAQQYKIQHVFKGHKSIYIALASLFFLTILLYFFFFIFFPTKTYLILRRETCTRKRHAVWIFTFNARILTTRKDDEKKNLSNYKRSHAISNAI